MVQGPARSVRRRADRRRRRDGCIAAELREGHCDGAKRFKVLTQFDGEVVLDRETGLTWQRSPSSVSSFDWGTSAALCIGTAIGGRRGWRLPTAWELMTLKDPAQSNPASPPNHPFQDVTTGVLYWTSTASADSPESALALSYERRPGHHHDCEEQPGIALVRARPGRRLPGHAVIGGAESSAGVCRGADRHITLRTARAGRRLSLGRYPGKSLKSG
jgi:hypothetical protein